MTRKGDIPVQIRQDCNTMSKLDKVGNKGITANDLSNTPHNWY